MIKCLKLLIKQEKNLDKKEKMMYKFFNGLNDKERETVFKESTNIDERAKIIYNYLIGKYNLKLGKIKDTTKCENQI